LSKKRLRVFAGPNGSGKTTLVTNLCGEGYFRLSVFINADIAEEKIKDQGFFDFSEFNIRASETDLKKYIKDYGAFVQRSKINTDQLLKRVSVVDNKFYFAGEINSYLSADICAFSRNHLLESGQSFIMETVFSHKSKLDLMDKAKKLGYNVYFYFVTTDDPEVNISRVKNRVNIGGHDVPEDKIVNRYYRSLDLLSEAIKLSDRAYLWDNSKIIAELVAEIHRGEGKIHKHVPTPKWLLDYVLNKNEPL